MKYLFVSPLGNDMAEGSEQNPFATVAKAQAEARKYSGSVTVYLRGGYHFLDEPICLDERDSFLTIKSYKDEKPILSGGKKVTNWERVSENVWRAKLTGVKSVREFYIDGEEAKRAASKTRIVPLGWYNDLSNLKTEADGIFVKKTDVENISSADKIQLHYCRGWRSMVVNVDGIVPYDEEKSIILSSHVSFSKARSGWHKISQDAPFIIENAMCFMDSEKDFYYNPEEEYLYCFSSDDMNEAECIVPVLETVLNICGSNLRNKVHDVAIEGITFSHITWYRPDKYGLITGQANVIDAIDTKSHELFDNSFVPAGVRVNAAKSVIFKNNVFFGFGAAALGFYEGVCGSRIESNVFYDIGDSAITVGLPHHNYEEAPCDGYNHAVRKRAYASEEYTGNEARRANSGDLKIGWFTDMPDPWWEVDLGENTDFNRIELVSGLDADRPDSRRNFSVLAATEENPGAYDVLYAVGDDDQFGYKSTLRICFDEMKSYRYVRIRRDIQHYFFINEVRVINTEREYIPVKEVCRDNVIADNIITGAGSYQWGAPAVTAYYTSGLEVTHNTIFDVAYSAISIGWGWSNYTDSTTCRNNSVTYNEVYDDVSVCFDGGAIYTLGNQYGSVIKGNYFHDHSNYPGTIYMDEGTEGYTITENVVENCDVPVFIHLATSKYINVYENYFTSPNYSNQGERCEVRDNTFFIPGVHDGRIAQIIENAGTRNRDLWDKIPQRGRTREKDKFYNIINETTSVPEPVFLTQCLKKSIYTLESIIRLTQGDERFTEEQVERLKALCGEAYDFLKRPYDSREQVIDFKLYLSNMTNAVLEGK